MFMPGELIRRIRTGEADGVLAGLYGPRHAAAQRERYAGAIEAFAAEYGERPAAVYSAPGRTEISGNHTDHNHGIVFAAAVNLDIIAVAASNGENVVRVKSKGFGDADVVDLARTEPVQAEREHSASLVRGVAAGLKRRGGKVGGFDAYTTSDVLKGSGLSSSAAFEVCLAGVMNGLYNEGRFTPLQLAMAGQYAENVFFGKPSGLMDQTASAVGGAVKIDFRDAAVPVVEKVPLNLEAGGYRLVITDTGGNHADLTADYAAIRGEMESVAAFFGKTVLREVEWETFVHRIAAVRAQTGDRAVLRAIHFFEECRRASSLAGLAAAGDAGGFMRLIRESGHSSFEYNQNAYSPARPARQGVSLGLALSQLALEGGGAWRLQGGGFAGTIQAFVPQDKLAAYTAALQGVFGPGACYVLDIRQAGCTRVF